MTHTIGVMSRAEGFLVGWIIFRDSLFLTGGDAEGNRGGRIPVASDEAATLVSASFVESSGETKSVVSPSMSGTAGSVAGANAEDGEVSPVPSGSGE
jgi:hypothetical protein